MASKSRTIAIGDIHGHFKALAGLIDLINPKPEDMLVFLGDYINRGPNSKGVLQFLIDLKQRCNVVCCLGNHEECMIDADAYPSHANMGWFLENGGNTTLQSYGSEKNFSLVPQEHKDFLLGLPLYYETKEHFFIHAHYDDCVELIDIDPSRALWRSLADLPRKHISGKTAILGHTPQMSGEILDLEYMICIDTGCGFGGKLTGLEVISRSVIGKLWQVDEQGREQGREAK